MVRKRKKKKTGKVENSKKNILKLKILKYDIGRQAGR